MSNVDKSIVFILDSKLIVLQHTSSVNESKLLQTVASEDKSKYLELSDKMLELIEKNYDQIAECSNLIFLVSTNAGFTDSRIIYNWLKSIQLFLNKPFFILKTESIVLPQIKDYIFQAIEEGNTHLIYLKEPNIGTK